MGTLDGATVDTGSVRLRLSPRTSSTPDSTAPALPTLSSVMLRLIPGTPAVHGEVAPAGAPAATVAADTLDGATVDTGSVRLRLSPRSSSTVARARSTPAPS